MLNERVISQMTRDVKVSNIELVYFAHILFKIKVKVVKKCISFLELQIYFKVHVEAWWNIYNRIST